LSSSAPDTPEGADSYEVDYTATTGEQNRWHTQMGGGDVIYPDRAEEDKKLLTYTSPPMETDVEITGHPLVTLYVRSTHEDGAFFVYLEDVAPDGRVTYLTEGQLRAISRKVSDEEPPYFMYGPYRTFTRDDAAPLVPGEVVELTFDLWAISALIKKDHRVRIAIAGADENNFARYPPNGDPTITVERNEGYASKITLPMVKR
jgi:putative CocE/NonD family hydrolase